MTSRSPDTAESELKPQTTDDWSTRGPDIYTRRTPQVFLERAKVIVNGLGHRQHSPTQMVCRVFVLRLLTRVREW